MNNQKKLLFLSLALVLLLGGAYVDYSRLGADLAPEQLAAQPPQEAEETADAADTEGEEQPAALAPDFTVLDTDGNQVRLSDYVGKPVVVNFWASWCTPCKQEMPEFEEMYKKYGEKVVFMMVNLTDGVQESKETAGSFIAQSGYTFPVYFDTQLSGVSAYGMNAVPATFFVDAQGNLAASHMGLITGQQLEENIGILLN